VQKNHTPHAADSTGPKAKTCQQSSTKGPARNRLGTVTQLYRIFCPETTICTQNCLISSSRSSTALAHINRPLLHTLQRHTRMILPTGVLIGHACPPLGFASVTILSVALCVHYVQKSHHSGGLHRQAGLVAVYIPLSNSTLYCLSYAGMCAGFPVKPAEVACRHHHASCPTCWNAAPNVTAQTSSATKVN
jgi:hypothetical protein